MSYTTPSSTHAVLSHLNLDDFSRSSPPITTGTDEGLGLVHQLLLGLLIVASRETSMQVLEEGDEVFVIADDPVSVEGLGAVPSGDPLRLPSSVVTDAAQIFAIRAGDEAIVIDPDRHTAQVAHRVVPVTPWAVPVDVSELQAAVSDDPVIAPIVTSAAASPSVVETLTAAGVVLRHLREPDAKGAIAQLLAGGEDPRQALVVSWVSGLEDDVCGRALRGVIRGADALGDTLEELLIADPEGLDPSEEGWVATLRDAAFTRERLESAASVLALSQVPRDDVAVMVDALRTVDECGERLSVVAPDLLSAPQHELLLRAQQTAAPGTWWVGA